PGRGCACLKAPGRMRRRGARESPRGSRAAGQMRAASARAPGTGNETGNQTGNQAGTTTMFGGIAGARMAERCPIDLPRGDFAMAEDGGGGANDEVERLKAQLKAGLGQEVYSRWFGRMKLAEASKGIVRRSVPTAFLRSWINSHYVDL